MSERAASVNDPLLPVEARQVDRLCDRFERAWQSGRRPHLEHYLLRAAQPVTSELLRELLALELDYRSRCGEKPAPQEYHRRFPEHTALIDAVFNDIHQSAAPKPKSLLPRWAVSSLVRQATALALSQVDRSAQPPGLLALWSHLLRPESASSTGSPQERPSDAINSEIVTTPLETDVGGAHHTTTGEVPVGDLPATAAAWPVLHGYEILGKIGIGGMGVVYRARDLRLNKIVALKVIRPDQLEDLPPEKRQQWLDRFRKEARAAARSEHANVVTVYDVNESHGQRYYSMRYVEGRSLADILRDGPLPNHRAAAYLETVARAVHYIHSCGVLHRDLKPKNILVDQNDHPLVADFGLAKWREDASESTQTLGPLGTPPYMSPEQAQYPVRVTAASDIYSLGATLYALVAGRPPFQAALPLETLRQVIFEDPVPPRQLNPAIDRDLELICLKCLQKEPHKRYASAEQLADELKRYLKHEPLKVTRPVRPPERLWRWCRRNPGLAVASGVAAVVLVALCISVGFAFERASAAKAILTEQQQTQRVSKKLTLQQGLTVLEQGDPARALHWLARGLTIAPEENPDLERALRMNLASCRSQVPSLRAVLAHEQEVMAAAFSPDSKTIVTCSGHDALLWDAVMGKLKLHVPHQAPVHAVAFSPDGKTIVTGSRNPRKNEGEAKLWDVASGKPIGPAFPHQAAVLAVAFRPDGKVILTGSADPEKKSGMARLWDVTTGKNIGSFLFHGGAISAAAFSPDGQRILTGSQDGTALLWDAANGKQVGQTLRHGGIVHSVAFSPDGKTVLTGSEDGTVRLWDAATGKPTGPSLPSQVSVRAVAFSPDGKSILTGSVDKTARLWEADTGKALGSPLPHQGAVTAAAFSADGKTILTGGEDKTVRLWDVTALLHPHPPLMHLDHVWTVAFSPDAKKALTASYDGTARLWEVPTGNPGAVLRHANQIWCVAFNPDGKTVLTGGRDTTARLWDAATGKLLHQLNGHQGFIHALAYSPDGQIVATASMDCSARLWDVATGRELHQLNGHTHPVLAVAFSPDGRTVLTGSGDGTARLWEVSTGLASRQFLGHQGPILVVAFSPDGKSMATGSYDKTAQLWDVTTGNPIGPPLTHRDEVRAVAFSPDGTYILTGSKDNTAQLWDAATGMPFGPALQHQGAVWAVAFSPDGRTALTASWDMTARLWDVATALPIGRPMHHEGAVSAAAFSPDGRFILTGSRDRTGRLWEVPAIIEGSAEQIRFWAEVITGMELDTSANDALRVLHAQAWNERRQGLKELGSAPAQ